MRLITAFTPYTPTASSEDSTAPASRLTEHSTPFRLYKATISGAVVNITLDVGVGNSLSGLMAVPGIFLNHVNVASLRIQGNSVSTNWTTPPWNQLVTIDQDAWTGRYKGFFRLSDLDVATFAYRFLNVQLNSSTTDGAPYSIGNVVLGSINEWSIGPAFGIERKVLHAYNRNEFLDGGSEVIELGDPYMTLRFQNRLPSVASRDTRLTIARLAPGELFVLWDSALGGTSDAWMVRRADEMELTQSFTTFYEGELFVREVV